MRLNVRTFGFTLTSLGALLLMTTMVVVSQGQQPQGPEGGDRPGRMGRPGGPPPDGFGRGPGGPRDGIAGITRHLNLSDAQKAQVAKISDALEASTKELHDQMRALDPGRPEPFSTKFDEAAFRSAAEARAKIEIELQVAHVRAMSQVANVLTEEQRAELVARRPGRPPRQEQ